MVQLSIKADTSKIQKDLERLAGDQLPWATTLSLNSIAQQVQKDLKSHLRRVFTVRREYVPNSIRIQRAQKKDWPHISASVGSINPFMINQVVGGEKQAKDQSTPLGAPIKARAVKAEIIPSKLWVRRLRDKKRGYFTINTAKGQRLLMERAKRGSDRESLKVLYVLQDKMKIKPRFMMVEVAGATFGKGYAGAFIAALEQVIKAKR